MSSLREYASPVIIWVLGVLLYVNESHEVDGYGCSLCYFPQRSHCPPAVVRRCTFMCFGVVALEGGLKGGDGIFFRLNTFKIWLPLAGFSNITKPNNII